MGKPLRLGNAGSQVLAHMGSASALEPSLSGFSALDSPGPRRLSGAGGVISWRSRCAHRAPKERYPNRRVLLMGIFVERGHRSLASAKVLALFIMSLIVRSHDDD